MDTEISGVTDYIVTNKPDIINNVTVLCKVRVGRDHRMVKAVMKSNLRRVQ